MIKPIQSLRAFAVIIVVLFHLNISVLERGYLGVDIFFTVSGFVIYMAYFEKIKRKRDIISFLSSRFFRLFPAYLVVTASVISFGYLLFLPADKNQLIIDGIYSVFSIINVYYIFTTNYFSIDTEYRPFLHFWSLAVEQQFYVIFSLYILMYLYAKNKNFLKIAQSPNANLYMIISITFVSFLLSGYLREIHSPADFFNPVTRSWQFGVGMIFAELSRRKSDAHIPKNFHTSLVLFYGSTFLLFYVAIIGFFENLLYDQLIISLLVAVICVIASHSVKKSILDSDIVQWIGQVSYSVYLVHWPVIVFYRFTVNRPFEIFEMALLVAVTLAMSALLHYSVEIPWKKWPTGKRWPRFAALLLLCVAALAAGKIVSAALYSHDDYDRRTQIRNVAGTRADIDQYCKRQPTDYNHGIICDIMNNPGAPVISIMGDSHVVPLVPALRKQTKYSIRLYIATGCLPLRNMAYTNHQQRVLCSEFFDAAFKQQPDGRLVILVARWNGYSEHVGSKQAIEKALAETMRMSHGPIQIMQQPFEFKELLPFALSYMRDGLELYHFKPTQGFFADGIPTVGATDGPMQPEIIYTRQILCNMVKRSKTEPNACIYSQDRGLFYADDNHLLPTIASELNVVK